MKKIDNIDNIVGWHPVHYNLEVPLGLHRMNGRFGEPIAVTSNLNGFKPDCIYENSEGIKIVYSFIECTWNLISIYAIYHLR